MQDSTPGFSTVDLSEIAQRLGTNPQRMWAAGARAKAILEALKQIRHACDGARLRDGVGFSKLWVTLGHWLAEQQALTSLQAAIGQYIVYRHRRQVPPPLLAEALGDLSLADLKGRMNK